MDHNILECTKANLEQRQNRFFVQGDPGAILAVELAAPTRDMVAAVAARLETELRAAGLGYHYPVVWGPNQNRVWNLRKAALGLLSNIPGDAKPVAVIEDTAIDPNDLPAFVQEFDEILGGHGLSAVHYAHAGSGELHLRPILNLKDQEHRRLFRVVGTEIAQLVKRYGGSLSGEHGDGSAPRRISASNGWREELCSLSRDQTRVGSLRYLQSGQDHRHAADGRKLALRTQPSRASI
jgi:FAD/FMN-containing dehydrogenase